MKHYIFISLLISFLIVLINCEDKNKKNISVMGNKEIPNQEVRDFVLIETNKGIKRWVLHSDSAAVFESKKIIYLTTVKVDFYKEDEKYYSTLTSKKGTLYQSTNNMEAIDSVVVFTEQGYKLETEKLYWKNKEGKIVSEDFVKITKGKDVITGIGLETDPELKNIELKKNVNAYVEDVKVKDND